MSEEWDKCLECGSQMKLIKIHGPLYSHAFVCFNCKSRGMEGLE